MYVSPNFKTKKELKFAVKKGSDPTNDKEGKTKQKSKAKQKKAVLACIRYWVVGPKAAIK